MIVPLIDLKIVTKIHFYFSKNPFYSSYPYERFVSKINSFGLVMNERVGFQFQKKST